MNAALIYAIKYVGNMERAVRFHRDELGLTLRFKDSEGAECSVSGS